MKHRPQLWLAIALLTLGLAGAAPAGGAGIVIEDVDKGSALERAGIRSGDLVLAWERSENPGEIRKGEIRTVFDWFWLQTEQAPRGTVRLHGEREGAATSFEVPAGYPWDARVRPRLAADLLRLYQEGRRRIDAGDPEGGLALWNQLAGRGEPQDPPELGCWILLEVSKVRAKNGESEKERFALEAALAQARDPQTRVFLAETLGYSQQTLNNLDLAVASYRSALEIGEATWGEGLQVASTLSKLGSAVRRQSRQEEAMRLQQRALEIRRRLAPDSLAVADSLNQLAGLVWVTSDLDGMAEHARRALEILDRWAPDSLETAGVLNHVAIAAMERGRFEEGKAALQRARAILERRAPDSITLAMTLGNLGAAARQTGDPELAMELIQRAVAIREKLAPGGLGMASNLSNLGLLAQNRGDLKAAEDYFRRSLAIWEKASPQGMGAAGNLNGLANVARLQGHLDEAWKLHHRALEMRERTAPGGLDSAESLGHLGQVAEARGDLEQALGFHQRALEIYRRLAPGTTGEAQTLQHMARLHRARRRPGQAAQLLTQAIAALESQVGRLGVSPERQAAFRASHEAIYHEAIEIALEQGRAAEAFHLVERSRARSFLTLLAERDLTFSGELPVALDRSREDNAEHYDRTLRELARWTPAAGEAAREALHQELGRLRREHDEIVVEIRKASPRLAALRQPQPLDLAAARQVLDPGTLALSYSVGEERTALFAVTREGALRVEILPVGEERLHEDVERFLEKIQLQEAPFDLAGSLFRTLIGPVADLVARSERVLILPDGPLHRLPFGALLRDTAESAGRRPYLAEWKPLHTALSLTVYGTLRASADLPPRPAGGAAGLGRLVAFGDPRYPKDLAPDAPAPDRVPHAGVQLSTLRSFNWAALPHTRREVERIAEMYPGARLYLGAEATEERAKSVPRDVRILHFATHGHLDDRTPLDSALVLSIPEGLPAGRDNGLLQVWEIFESVRLDADLVVLSTCDSALGRELSGEGMIGLTRAFQYAGARSVVATLWSVADQITSELMARFYRHLAAGLPKDEALRAAQTELIRQPITIATTNGQTLEMDASAPFFWAAFQLFGDRQ